MKEEYLKPYQQYLEDLTKTFDKIESTIIPKAQNQFADALATLVSSVEIPEGMWTWPLEIEQSYEEVHKRKTEALVMIVKEEEVPWYYDVRCTTIGPLISSPSNIGLWILPSLTSWPAYYS